MKKGAVNIKSKILDIIYMTKDFFKIIGNKDYFHQEEKIGDYFLNKKSYYIDFKEKVKWTGKYVDNVPVLHVPSLKEDIYFPGMIIQYGLGSIDMYFLTGEDRYHDNIENVYNWILKNINKDYYFNNMMDKLDENYEYYSNNSALTQGQAISFLVRVVQYRLVKAGTDEITKLIKNIFNNFVLGIEGNGTVFKRGEDVYFCEYPRKETYIVLNGWVFAIFGLYDYQFYFKDDESKRYLNETLNTLKKDIEKFLTKERNWSYYDNNKRLCSYIYEELHINMMHALFELAHEEKFREIENDLRAGNNFLNRIKYTIIKIKDKIKDSYRYTTG